MIRFLKKHPWVLILVLGVFLIPQSLAIQSQLNERLILTGMAVDKGDDGYEVVAQVVIAGSSAGSVGQSGKVDYIKSKGKTISECANEISYLIGKTAGFTHVNFVVFGKSLAETDGIVDALDYFVRDRKVPNSALVLIASDNAGKELVKTQNMELDTAVGLQRLYIYKETAMNGHSAEKIVAKIQEFLDNYFNISSSGIISEFKVEDEEVLKQDKQQSADSQSSSSSSSGGSSGASGESGGSSQGGASSGGASEGPPSKPRIEFDSAVYLLKEGKIAVKISDEDQLVAINLLNPDSEEGIISVENVNDEFFKNATVGVRVYQKKTKYKAYFDQDGNPHFKILVDLRKNDIQEINNEVVEKEIYSSKNVYLTDALIKSIESYAKENIEKVCQTATENNVDFLNCGNKLYQKSAKKWKKFLSSIENPSEYLQHVQFEIEVIARKDT